MYLVKKKQTAVFVQPLLIKLEKIQFG